MGYILNNKYKMIYISCMYITANITMFLYNVVDDIISLEYDSEDWERVINHLNEVSQKLVQEVRGELVVGNDKLLSRRIDDDYVRLSAKRSISGIATLIGEIERINNEHYKPETTTGRDFSLRFEEFVKTAVVNNKYTAMSVEDLYYLFTSRCGIIDTKQTRELFDNICIDTLSERYKIEPFASVDCKIYIKGIYC